MASVLSDLVNITILIYFEDIIILGAMSEELVDNIIKVLEVFRMHNLKINLKKRLFFHPEIQFLGHIVSKEGI